MYPVLDMDDFTKFGTYSFLKDLYLSNYTNPTFVNKKIQKFFEDPTNINYFIRFPFQCSIDIEKVKDIFKHFSFEILYSYDIKWEFIAKKKYLTPDGFIETKASEDVLLGNSLKKNGVELKFLPSMKINHFCRTEIQLVKLNMEKLGSFFVKTRKLEPSLRYSFLAESKWYILLIFFLDHLFPH